jgi:predicted nuclease of predicted toxin-antitoxin system
VKFLVDAQLPPSLAEWLRATGGEAIHVEEAGLRDAVDSAIREYAVSQGYVLITKDKDFVPAESPRPQFQVVWIRTGNVPNRVLIGRLEAGWPRILAHLEDGAPVVELR